MNHIEPIKQLAMCVVGYGMALGWSTRFAVPVASNAAIRRGLYAAGLVTVGLSVFLLLTFWGGK